MPDSQFYDFITNKVKHSLTEPGEAVGLLCAQVGTVSYFNMFLKGYPLKAKTAPKN